MEAPPKRKEELLLSPPPSPLFAAAVSKVAVAQICRSVGYHGAEPAALRSLADVAARYLVALARSAASIANARGRTECNLLDLVRAMEGVSLPRGFAGASNAALTHLRSGVLTELMGFVGSVDEIPFPKPIRRREAPSKEEIPRGPSPSFAQMGRDPPLPHVPRWLPCFPESWWEGCGKKGEEGMGAAVEERDAIKEGEARRTAEDNRGERQGLSEAATLGTVFPAKRERVRFKLGFGKGCDAGVCLKRNKRVLSSSWNWGNDENGAGGATADHNSLMETRVPTYHY